MAEQPASSDIPLRLVLIGTLIAAIAYGLLASTFFHCLELLITNKTKAYTNRARSFLAVYITTMFLFSTRDDYPGLYVHRESRNGGTRTNFIHSKSEFAHHTSTCDLGPGWDYGLSIINTRYSFILLIHTAYFQLWRCAVLFVDESYFRRILLSLILGLCGCLSFGELGR